MEVTITINHPDAAEIARQLTADSNPAEIIALGLANIAEYRADAEDDVEAPVARSLTDDEAVATIVRLMAQHEIVGMFFTPQDVRAHVRDFEQREMSDAEWNAFTLTPAFRHGISDAMCDAGIEALMEGIAEVVESID